MQVPLTSRIHPHTIRLTIKSKCLTTRRLNLNEPKEGKTRQRQGSATPSRRMEKRLVASLGTDPFHEEGQKVFPSDRGPLGGTARHFGDLSDGKEFPKPRFRARKEGKGIAIGF
jgi:hypothetical protein